MQSKVCSVEVKTFVTGVQLTLTKDEAERLINYMSKTYFEPDVMEHALANDVIRHLTCALNGETT